MLTEAKPEIMKAHRIGPPDNFGNPRMVIMKMLRFTDRDLILRASRNSAIKVDGKDIRFSTDYSPFTINWQHSFAEVTQKSQKMGFQTFLLLCPAQLKLIHGSVPHVSTPLWRLRTL